MYENFAFKNRDGAVCGYHFPCEEATHVMCVIHGIGEHAGRYLRMADRLSAVGIAVIAMDLRGHGISKAFAVMRRPERKFWPILMLCCNMPAYFIPDFHHPLRAQHGRKPVSGYRARGQNNDVPEKYIVSAPWIKLVMKIPEPLYLLVKGLSGSHLR